MDEADGRAGDGCELVAEGDQRAEAFLVFFERRENAANGINNDQSDGFARLLGEQGDIGEDALEQGLVGDVDAVLYEMQVGDGAFWDRAITHKGDAGLGALRFFCCNVKPWPAAWTAAAALRARTRSRSIGFSQKIAFPAEAARSMKSAWVLVDEAIRTASTSASNTASTLTALAPCRSASKPARAGSASVTRSKRTPGMGRQVPRVDRSDETGTDEGEPLHRRCSSRSSLKTMPSWRRTSSIASSIAIESERGRSGDSVRPLSTHLAK